jgi:hypothetical protein
MKLFPASAIRMAKLFVPPNQILPHGGEKKMKKVKDMKAAFKFVAFCAAIAAAEGLIIRFLNIIKEKRP